jgi:hypothetical protein
MSLTGVWMNELRSILLLDEDEDGALAVVSTELAAYKNVDTERARSDLEERQFVCVSAATVRQSGPRTAMAPTTRQ